MDDSTSNPLVKPCSRCGQPFPRTPQYFYRDAQKPDGLRPNCKSCSNAVGKQWRKDNPDKALANAQRQRENMTPEQKAHQRETIKRISYAKYWADPEAASRKYKKYYSENKEFHHARKKKYEALHPEKRRAADRRRAGTPRLKAKSHRRNARKLGLPDSFTAQDWQHALDYFGGCCAVCGKAPDFWTTLAADHWIPLASPDCLGTVPKNIIPLCHAKKDGQGTCNNEKHSRDALEWLISKYDKCKASAIMKRIQAYFDSLTG